VIRREDVVIRKIESYCRAKDVLEIGCGDGSRLAEVVRTSNSWYGIDRDPDAVRQARASSDSAHVEFVEGRAETLAAPDGQYDVVLFTLSLHHIGIEGSTRAIDEAVRVLRPTGKVLFLEPLPEGTFFDAEMRFGCCDGDERKELAYAHYAMLNSEKLTEIEEFIAQVSFEYDSFDDFLLNVPTIDNTHAGLEEFLATRNFVLDEKWRLNVFRLGG
jgi:ubiquinone/menaquinone biosynthesis C-methylase UbiE